jgi:hypothetical protein
MDREWFVPGDWRMHSPFPTPRSFCDPKKVNQIFCPDCDSFQPVYEEPPHADPDGFAYGDLVCIPAGS